MAKGETFKLEDNLPVTGPLSAVDYAPTSKPDEGYPDQVKLFGEAWVQHRPEGETALGGGRFYLHLSVADQLLEAGVLHEAGQDAKGHPKYRVSGKPMISVVRTHNKDGVQTTVNVVGAPARAASAAAPAAPAKSEAGPGKPPPPPQTAKDAKAQKISRSIKGWTVLEATYARCIAVARSHFEDDEQVAACAATLLIQAAKEGYWLLPAPKAPAPPTDTPKAVPEAPAKPAAPPVQAAPPEPKYRELRDEETHRKGEEESAEPAENFRDEDDPDALPF